MKEGQVHWKTDGITGTWTPVHKTRQRHDKHNTDDIGNKTKTEVERRGLLRRGQRYWMRTQTKTVMVEHWNYGQKSLEHKQEI